MLGDMMAEYGGRLLIATSGVGLALMALVALLRFMRRHNGRLPFGLATHGTVPQRLQVLETTVVDARRRLLLIRRDEVEHLILIGGPADLVIESDIARTGRQTPPRAALLPSTSPASPALGPAPPRMEQSSPPPQSRTARPDKPAALERPLPVTPHAAYVEASDDFAAPPEAERSSQLREAEAHLEAVRHRVLATGEQMPPATAGPSGQTSGFARILDEEMKSPLHEIPRALATVKPQTEPDLQSEIARIFGKAP